MQTQFVNKVLLQIFRLLPPILTQCVIHFLKTTKLCLSIQIWAKEASLCPSKHSDLYVHCCGNCYPMCRM